MLVAALIRDKGAIMRARHAAEVVKIFMVF
jgi:hypothetical protein